MRYLILFYLFAIVYSSVVFSSCTKTDAGAANTQQDILIRYKWKHYQTRTITVDTLTNTVIKDTLTQVDLCYQNSLFVFATDSVVKRNIVCFTPASNNEGRWFLKADSTFSASIMVRASFGTGYIYIDMGLPYGKMKLLTDNDFQLSAISYNGFSSLKYFNTLYLKAEN